MCFPEGLLKIWCDFYDNCSSDRNNGSCQIQLLLAFPVFLNSRICTSADAIISAVKSFRGAWKKDLFSSVVFVYHARERILSKISHRNHAYARTLD